MKFLKNILDKQRPHFSKGGKFEKLHPLFDAFDTLLFVPDHTTAAKGTQIKDAVDMKRMMMTVIIAMLPCLVFGMWNVGHQHFLALGQADADFMSKLFIGLWITLPLIVVSYGVGLGIEFYFAIRRGHSVNEGYLVTGMLIPLIMPPSVPLWQVAVGTAFAVIIGKEVFGGTGMNILNVALTMRAFLYFAYPADMAGDIKVWTYFEEPDKVELAKMDKTYTGATPLGLATDVSKKLKADIENTKVAYVDSLAEKQDLKGAEMLAFRNKAMKDAENLDKVKKMKAEIPNKVVTEFAKKEAELFGMANLMWGTIPGSVGETSLIMCLIGAFILIVTGVGSWKIIISGFTGAYLLALLFYALGGNAFMAMPPHYHLMIGGLAFGVVFMATDPVSAAQTEVGKWIYGFLIGALTVLIRVFNPAYPEGIMLAILLMNVLAPMIDYYVVAANKKRRLKRLQLKTA